MIINPQLANSVRQAWIADQEHPHRGREKRNYPEEGKLAEVLDIAFRISLLNEEGRSIRGSITLLSPDDLERFEIPRRRGSPLIVRLYEPLQFEVNIVAKLVNVTEAGSSSLLVSWFADICKVWGIIYYSKTHSLLTEIPAGIREDRHLAPDSPTVEITGAGSLKINRSRTVIGRIESGEFRVSVPTPFASRAMGSILHDLFDIRVNDRYFSTKEDARKAGVYFACLEYLLLQIDNRGGGATVIFVPDSSVASAREFARFPWDSEGGLELRELIQCRIRYEEDQETSKYPSLFMLKANEALRHRLDGLAKLTSMDGALILTPDFGLIGFGAKLHAPEYNGQVQEGTDGWGNRGGIIDFTSLGTRHNSALHFVTSVSGSVAFVASEDGPIRGLVKLPSGEVNCWPDCRISMFA